MTTHPAAAPKRGFSGALRALVEALRRRAEAAQAAARDREILRKFAQLDDSLLADIGLARADILRIADDLGVRI